MLELDANMSRQQAQFNKNQPFIAEGEAEERGLTIIKKIRAASKYEIEHYYINAKGNTGTFADFVKREAQGALKLFKHSTKWSTIQVLMSRYAFIDLTTRMHVVKQIRSMVKELEELYLIKLGRQLPASKAQPVHTQGHSAHAKFKSPKKSKEEKSIDPNLDISELEVKFVKGIGPSLAIKLAKLGINSCEDLLKYHPRDHISYEEKTEIRDLVEDQDVTVFAVVDKVTAYKSPKKNLVIVNIELKDNTGKLKITKYFQGNSIHFYLKQIKGQFPDGTEVLCAGHTKKDKFTKKITLSNPIMEVVAGDISETDNIHTARIVPIYPLTEGLSLTVLRRLIYKTLDSYKANLKEFIPQDILDRYQLMTYPEAIQEIHFPTSMDAKNDAARRLIFNEFFLMQLHFASIRRKAETESKGIKFNLFENGIVDKYIESLPFALTGAQERVFFRELLPDMVKEAPMHRLVQGDVGSGKTVVAFLAMLVAVADGYQAAMMVPTEILAEQHYAKFVEAVNQMGEQLGLRVALLIGKQKAKTKRAVLEGLATGAINIVVGTHALIQDSVEFSNLGLIVIDEQHRFGVKQREQLALKSKHETNDSNKAENEEGYKYSTVEKLFMTATPIPRTMALAAHGDLDLSEIDEMPAGRKDIITEMVHKKSEAHKKIKNELDKGHQAYIVFPLIEESETLSAKAASVEFEKMQQGAFKNYRMGLMHGRLPDDEKEAIMEAFRRHELDLLVSTTVIEVGVDVPNATIMMIESAERFGLAQLHQLRGRVGRNDLQSYCLLSTASKTETTRARLSIMCESNNGFLIAQHDMMTRGAGDFAGLRQSGMPEAALNALVDNEELLEIAREAAKSLIHKSPDLSEYERLSKKLAASAYAVNYDAG